MSASSPLHQLISRSDPHQVNQASLKLEMNHLTPQAESVSGIQSPRPARRHACDECRSQKLRCDRTEGILIACDRCARNNLTCVTGASMSMGRPRSLNPKARYRRKYSRKSDEMPSNAAEADSSTLPSCTTTSHRSPDLTMVTMNAVNELPEIGFSHEDLVCGVDPSTMDFSSRDFSNMDFF